MKNILISVVLITLLAACSKSNDSSSTKGYVEYKLQSQGDGTFGVVDFGKQVIKNFTFKNDAEEAVSLTPTISNSSFDIGAVVGCQNLEPNKSCLVKVVFSALTKESGEYSANLLMGNLSIPLNASIASVPSVAYEFSINNNLISENANLGALPGNHLKLFSVKVKNNSPKKGSPSSLIFSNPRFTIVGNYCNNVTLKPAQVCQVKAYVRGDNTNSELVSDLSFDGQTSAFSYSQTQQNLSAQMMSLESSISLGDFYQEGQKKLKLINVQNQGQGVGSIEQVTLPPGYILLSNNCHGVKPTNTCQIRLAFESSNSDKGQYVDEVGIGDDTVSLVNNKVSNPNSLGSLVITTGEDLKIGQCHEIQVQVKEISGGSFILSENSNLTVNFPLYADNNCQVESTQIDAFQGGNTFYIKSDTVQQLNLTVAKASVQSSKSLNFYTDLSVEATAPVITSLQSISLIAQGGKAPYSYSKVSGIGSITNNIFSSLEAGNAQLKVVDALNQEVLVNVQVVLPLSSNISSFEKW